jgi:hypothetical protein
MKFNKILAGLHFERFLEYIPSYIGQLITLTFGRLVLDKGGGQDYSQQKTAYVGSLPCKPIFSTFDLCPDFRLQKIEKSVAQFELMFM